MEYRGSSTDCRSEIPAKAQRRKVNPGFYCWLVWALSQRNLGVTRSFAPLRLCGILFLLLGVASPYFAQSRGPMRPSDIVRVANVTDAQISPNGQYVAYTVFSVADDKTVSTIWIARLLPEIQQIQPTAQPTPRPPSGRGLSYLEWPELRST